MGGFGSGDWARHGCKCTVEQCLALTIWNFPRPVGGQHRGTVHWTWGNGRQASAGFSIAPGERPGMTVEYRWNESEEVSIPIRLQATDAQFGGKRWWFTCPLIVNGVVCQRRVGKLFLPPKWKYFGCRHCYRLTYKRCRLSHEAQREIARDEEMLAGMLRLLSRHR